MNIVLDEAEEYHVKKNTKNPIGRIMLKGDNVALVCNISYFFSRIMMKIEKGNKSGEIKIKITRITLE